ncbi:hypothetical protein LTR91_019729 [Friedmanniomyces endolithicus]|uniref:Uncharacterized protein n=1 Tax=Friedmanniomyces endolithicus TaxID=329885 RepID=A0AAN6HA65_9PEZI|nr:hypothetical protein LTR94_010918 [Friedmanniomyces endolithicus]KAK0791683.1 hypothetical protein LTR38_010117 [Friedmanniomyces endolithicus]KAK0804089.1 hypothetical protein LTR59_004535 [Friedmanniomyces endolithicus]KAK0819112.1 hypothetical protein LTR75_002316 [Friedmanniomyces endolithicus]KAK0860412.1 hypothetical protein LTS02_008529 [Friedmanniomyces endolithicus]
MSYGNRHWEEQGRSSGQWAKLNAKFRARGNRILLEAEAEAGKLEHWMSTPSRVMAYLELGGMFQDKRSSVLTRDTEKHVIRGV